MRELSEEQMVEKWMDIIGIKAKVFWMMVHITLMKYEYLKKIYTVTTEFKEIKENQVVKTLAKEYLFGKKRQTKPPL